MDKVKINNFKREYPEKDFPEHKSLTIIEAEKIEKTFAALLELMPNSSPLELVKTLLERSVTVPDQFAESDAFNLKDTIAMVGISAKEKAFINWYRFDQIDEISLDELSKYFDNIWYPAVDHIDIFDESCSWLVSIGYSGEIGYIKFPCIDTEKLNSSL